MTVCQSGRTLPNLELIGVCDSEEYWKSEFAICRNHLWFIRTGSEPAEHRKATECRFGYCG